MAGRCSHGLICLVILLCHGTTPGDGVRDSYDGTRQPKVPPRRLFEYASAKSSLPSEIKALINIQSPKHLGKGRDAKDSQEYTVSDESIELFKINSKAAQDFKQFAATNGLQPHFYLHGTKPQNIWNILQSGGFQKRPSVNGGDFGEGMYGALNFEKFDQYVSHDSFTDALVHLVERDNDNLPPSLRPFKSDIQFGLVVRAVSVGPKAYVTSAALRPPQVGANGKVKVAYAWLRSKAPWSEVVWTKEPVCPWPDVTQTKVIARAPHPEFLENAIKYAGKFGVDVDTSFVFPARYDELVFHWVPDVVQVVPYALVAYVRTYANVSAVPAGKFTGERSGATYIAQGAVDALKAV